jgi:hypothetical protein
VFCDGVQHRLQFYLDHLSCVKMAGNIKAAGGQIRRLWWAGDDSHVVFSKKLPGEEESMIASSLVAKVRGEVFAIFMQLP